GLRAVLLTEIAMRALLHPDALVGAVFAGDITKVATNAFVRVNLGHDFVVEIEIAPVIHLRHGFADDIHGRRKAFVFEIILEAFNQVAHNPEAVVHGCSAYLDRGRAQQHELHCVVPVADAANAGDRNVHGLGDRRDHVQRDGFDCRAAVPTVAAPPGHRGTGSIGIKIDANQAVECVDQGDRISPAGFGGPRHVGDVCHIGRELHDHRRARYFFYPAGNHGGVLRHLAHGRAHAAFAHAVRTAEVQLQHVGAGGFGPAYDVMPGFELRFDHQRCDHRVLGETLLDFRNLAQVCFDGAVSDEFDVVQAHHALVLQIYGPVARDSIDDGFTDGLPHRAAPAQLK